MSHWYTAGNRRNQEQSRVMLLMIFMIRDFLLKGIAKRKCVRFAVKADEASTVTSIYIGEMGIITNECEVSTHKPPIYHDSSLPNLITFLIKS